MLRKALSHLAKMFEEDEEVILSDIRTPNSLRNALGQLLLRNPRLAEQFTFAVAKDLWMKTNTPAILNATGEITYREGVLFIQILNPSLRANLNGMRREVCRQLNERMEFVSLRDVKFV